MGFYYDEQLNNRSYTVRLYGNGNGKGDYPNLVAKSIWTENFEFSTSNTWSNFESIGNPLESAFNTVNKFSGYANPIVDTIAALPKVKSTSLVGRSINKFTQWVGSNRDEIKGMMNSHLIVQGTRFIYFGGSNVDMGNLMMKYTIMYDPAAPAEQRTVRQQLAKLMPYCIGDYVTAKEQANKDADGLGVLSLIGWQTPPGEFTADWKNVDTQGKGTLKLVFGGNGMSTGSDDSHREGDFEIDNLVVKDWNVSTSRVMSKSINPDERGPLYADVTLTFQLAGYITRDKLVQFLKLPTIPK